MDYKTVDLQFVRDEIDSAVCRIWEVAFSQSVTLESDIRKIDPTSLSRMSQIQITGAWKGTLIVATTEVFNQEIARKMFDLEFGEDASDDMTDDVLREIANLIGGNLKSVLPEPCQLSLPELVEEPSILPVLLRNAGRVIMREFSIHEHQLTVFVFLET